VPRQECLYFIKNPLSTVLLIIHKKFTGPPKASGHRQPQNLEKTIQNALIPFAAYLFFDYPASWSAPHLALQPGMGILSQRRLGADLF
jgi:hypothetical protein